MYSKGFLILYVQPDGIKKRSEVLGNLEKLNTLLSENKLDNKWQQTTEDGNIRSSHVNESPGLWEKIYWTPKASNFIHKEKANGNEPPDIQVKATHQLTMKPIYPGWLQLKLK